jgi:uncharacterized membrane protein
MPEPMLYLGDTSRTTAAAYLLSLLAHWDWECDYVPSDRPLDASLLASARSLFVVSDYPSSQISDELQHQIVNQVSHGAGLLMVGGWESFHGLDGDWDGTPVGEILPVAIGSSDDRVNCDHPVLLRKVSAHPSVDGLPWSERPPLIGGFNRVTVKPDAQVVLEAVHFAVTQDKGSFHFTPQSDADPLLVVGLHGAGRTAALMTDVAPHWVGPLVDWGPQRVHAKAGAGVEAEVGNLYAAFLRQLLSWISRRG